MHITFNIETATDEESPSVASLSVEAMPAPSGWKDPIKIRERQEENFMKELSTAMLEPLTGKIVCISHQNLTSDGAIAGDIVSNCAPQPEHDMLDEFARYIRPYVDSTLVTYNGESFDVPYTISRMMAHGISIPPLLRKAGQKKWDSHLDMFKVMNKSGKLKEWALRFGMEPLFGDGSLVGGWYDEEDYASILRHCEDNVRATTLLARRYVG